MFYLLIKYPDTVVTNATMACFRRSYDIACITIPRSIYLSDVFMFTCKSRCSDKNNPLPLHDWCLAPCIQFPCLKCPDRWTGLSKVTNKLSSIARALYIFLSWTANIYRNKSISRDNQWKLDGNIWSKLWIHISKDNVWISRRVVHSQVQSPSDYIKYKWSMEITLWGTDVWSLSKFSIDHELNPFLELIKLVYGVGEVGHSKRHLVVSHNC